MDPFSVDLCETDIRLDEDDFFQPFFRGRTTTWPKAAFTVTVYSSESKAPTVNVSCVNRQPPVPEYKPQQAVNHQTSNIHPGAKRHTHKSNPWGDATYAELISRAISTSPEHRLKLPQIYEWIARNVPYFSEQDAHGSICWKNSIRHTLSLSGNPFVRIPDDHPGKSSWWAVEAKEGHVIKPSIGSQFRRRANTACVNELQRMRENAVRKATETVAASNQSCETQTEPPETIDEVLGEFFPLCNNSAFDSDPYGKRFRCRTVSLTSAGLMRIDERMPDYGVARGKLEARDEHFEANRPSGLLAEAQGANNSSCSYSVPQDGYWEQHIDTVHHAYQTNSDHDWTHCQEFNGGLNYGRHGPDVSNDHAWTQPAAMDYESSSTASSKSSSPQAQTVPQAYAGFDSSHHAPNSTSGSMAISYASATCADTSSAVYAHQNTAVLLANTEVPQQIASCNILKVMAMSLLGKSEYASSSRSNMTGPKFAEIKEKDISFTVITASAGRTNQRDVSQLPGFFADCAVKNFDALTFAKEADCPASLQDLDFHFDTNGNICF